MAEFSISELQAATDDYWLNNQPVDVWFRSHVLMPLLMKRNRTYDGGYEILANMEYDRQHAASYGPKSVLPVAKKELLTNIRFDYAAYYGIMTLDMDDQLKNSGESAIVDLTLLKIRNAEKSIRETMAVDLYKARADGIAADPLCRPFHGLADIFNQDVNFAYGGITPAQFGSTAADRAKWLAGFIDGGIMSFGFMQQLYRKGTVDDNNDGKPDLFLTTEDLFDSYERLVQTQVVLRNESLQNLGFENLKFKGASLVSDQKQTAGYVDALNLRYIDMITHARRNFTKPEWKSPDGQPDTKTANIRYAGQLICRRRNAQARAINVTPSA